MVELIIGFLAGFVVGALVFRANSAKGEIVVSRIKSESEKLKDKINTRNK